jgi:hypothetical protein
MNMVMIVKSNEEGVQKVFGPLDENQATETLNELFGTHPFAEFDEECGVAFVNDFTYQIVPVSELSEEKDELLIDLLAL